LNNGKLTKIIKLFYGVAGTVQYRTAQYSTVLKNKDAKTMYLRIDGPTLIFPVWFLYRSIFYWDFSHFTTLIPENLSESVKNSKKRFKTLGKPESP
jgi:hypothetical protein